MFPILQSHCDVALIFRKCQLHTAWEFLHENDGSERPAAWHHSPNQTKPNLWYWIVVANAWHGQLQHWQGRQHPE